MADQKNRSPGYWLFRDRLAGLDDFRAASAGTAPTDYARPVEGLCAVDARTLRLKLTRPWPQLTWALAMHYAFAISG